MGKKASGFKRSRLSGESELDVNLFYRLCPLSCEARSMYHPYLAGLLIARSKQISFMAPHHIVRPLDNQGAAASLLPFREV